MKILGWIMLLPMIFILGYELIDWIKEHDREEILFTFFAYIILIIISLMAGYGVFLIISSPIK